VVVGRLARERAGALRGAQGVALGVLCMVLFLTFLDNTVVSVALGNIQSDLGAGVSALQWVVGAYALTFASLMLACGMIGDELGRKKVMLTGAGVFCAGSILSALAPNVSVLIAGRAIMGLGAAASEPGTLSMLRQLYPERRSRDRAVGVWAGVSGLALALGPVIGGVLVGIWDWEAIFWFNVLFGLVALVVAAVVLPESADPNAHRVDTPGTLLGSLTLACLVFAIIQGEASGFSSTAVIVLFCVAALGLVAFVWWERRAPHPLLDLRYLRLPAFSTSNVTAYCTYFATFAIFFITALYLELVVGYSGYGIAKVFLPMTILMIAASVVTGRVGVRVPARWSILGGCVLFGAGLLLTNFTLGAHTHYLPLAASLALTGIGIGVTVVPVTSTVLSAVPSQRSGMAASSTNTSREIGAVTGVAVLGALVNAALHSDLHSRLVHLGIPISFQSIVINAVETGKVPTSGHSAGAGGAAGAGNGKLVNEVIDAAYAAFRHGLHDALYLSAALVFAAGLLAAFTLHSRARSADA
jgi:EmrB/QacA subfamily drug resistance transporter